MTMTNAVTEITTPPGEPVIKLRRFFKASLGRGTLVNERGRPDGFTLSFPGYHVDRETHERCAGTIGPEAAALEAESGRIVYRFHARDVNLIIGPGGHGTPVRFRVRIDGQPPGAAHGVDVDAQGNGTVTEPRMYQLIRQSGPIADRTFDIEFIGAGVQAFDFTFG